MKNILSTGVFERYGNDTMSPNAFYTALALSVIWGLIGTAVAGYYTIQLGYNPTSIWEILIIGLGLPILGIFIALKNDNPVISFIGYNLVCIPFGVVLAPALQEYSPDVVMNAFGLTAVITFIMGFAGTIFPNIFSKLGGVLFLALCGLILVRILQIFIPALDLGIIDYISAGIFSLYIGYDMYRAHRVPKTLDSAIDVSVSLYLDIINLFLSILRIMGNSND
ncbi:MAG: Bax inhibitor-1 family protein [Candidatus Pacebacteria bacterium]|nr:Bax inhibitor-1 family protein [Candidatus Paceibacterota bacterium]